MSDNSERLEMLAAMYNAPDDIEAKNKRTEVLQPDGIKRSRRMVMGAVAFDVPTVDYVTFLENRIAAQNASIKSLENDVTRIKTIVSDLQRHTRRAITRLGDVSRNLDNKIDRRD